MKKNKATARIKINKLLRDPTGVFASSETHVNIQVEPKVSAAIDGPNALTATLKI